MIAFSCTQCGMKFQVQAEFAGRKTRCPTCKQRLVVPALDRTKACVPEGAIDGTPSSVAQAGLDGGGVTLGPSSHAPPAGQKSLTELLTGRARKGERYLLDKEIARGGMGAVLRAVDCDIRREVAVKYLLDQADAGKRQRFVEEAQITGQLEHPNIVPIHELGVDSQKRLFFSMKMVQGRSLADILKDLRDVPRIYEREWTLSRLLTLFVGVCNAMAYAHSRGVVHRDLKPANIMVGDFGEVYVMDWGVAKVLHAEGPEVGNASASSTVALPKRPSKVETSREPEADLTQEGAILGTPVYMPPEQATGDIHAIDPRSDIYALGAILYELLTLQPPIDKEGGHLAVLVRVAEGAIVPPPQRSPQRYRAGNIPKELAAVAMKALAKRPQDRYPDVGALRQDIERFQEGRSVSAKHDTFREAAWKLVRRNKGASTATFLGLLVLAVVLTISFLAINRGRLRAEEARGQAEAAYADYRRSQEEKRAQARASVPAFVRAARLAVNEKQFKEALDAVNVALEYAPENAEARLLKGQVLIIRGEFAAAGVELAEYLRLEPADAEAGRLAGLCQRPRPDDAATLLEFAQVFLQQKSIALADGILSPHGPTSSEARQKLLEIYRRRIDAAWPGLGERLMMDPGGIYRLHLWKCPQVGLLDPLQGMPLTSLNLGNCPQVRDLTPLHGMPLTRLDLFGCSQVRDLTPLHGMPLTGLNLYGCVQVRDLTPLHGMPLTWLNLHGCVQVRDLTPLLGMPLTSLSLLKCDQVRDLTPLEGMKLEEVSLNLPKNLQGMDVLRRMKSLRTIGTVSGDKFPAEEFWKRYDAGQFK